MVVMDAPVRTIEQRRDALLLANRVRFYRSKLKADVKAGRVLAQDVLADPAEEVETMKVYDLLLAIPRYGGRTVDRLLYRCSISPAKTIGGMTERQRKALVYAVWGERIS